MGSVPASILPTNRDENWRYANLRPLARAKPEQASPAPWIDFTLPAPLPGHERWVFTDGRFDASRSTVAAGSPPLLPSTGDGGAAFQSMLDGGKAWVPFQSETTS